MKPDEYFRMMYPYIGQAKQPAEYLDDLLCNFIVDDADFAGCPLTDKTPDYKNRIYNGSKPFPISLAAQLLDASDPTCPFCNGKMTTQKTKSYVEAARSELSRIVTQYNDLVGAEKDIEQQIQKLQAESELLAEQKSSIEDLISKDLKPQAKALSETIDAYRVYIQLNNELEVIRRLADGWNNELRDMQNEDESEIKYKPMEKFDDRFWAGMDAALTDILTECKYTPLISARFSKSSFDLEINGQVKALTQGKGYCSILNTIVVMAFRKFMLDNAVYNPGLRIIDTPLHGIDEGTKNETTESVQNALFQYFINSREMGQLIIVENERTLPKLDYEQSGVRQVIFTGVIGEERCGFLHDCKFDIS